MIQIFVPAFNRPDFLDLQSILFDKFLLDDEYQLNVIDDSREDYITEKMKRVSEHRNIKYYKTPSEWERLDSGRSHCRVLQWMFDTLAKEQHRDDMIMIIDHDCFLISEFCIYDYIKDYLLAGLEQRRGNVEYVATSLIFLNMPKILERDDDIKFHPGMVEGEMCDSGGNIHHWLSRNNFQHRRIEGVSYPNTFNGIDLKSSEIQEQGGLPMEFFMHTPTETFLHYRGACNWFAGDSWQKKDSEPVEKKHKIFVDMINTILKKEN